MPRWSDGEAAADASAAAMATDADAPTPASGPGAAATHDADACPWCATPTAEGATRCTTCGAALAQRESIGDLVIPGLTAVDPALKDLEGRPLHLRGPSPSQGVASGLIVAAAAGGPVGLAIIGGVGAIAATEYLGAGGNDGKGHEHVGEASEAVLQAIARLDRGESLPTAADETPRPGVETATPQQVRDEEEPIDGRS
jgi:hypothetical protein